METGFISRKELYKYKTGLDIIGSVWDESEKYILVKGITTNNCSECIFSSDMKCNPPSWIDNIICRENNAVYNYTYDKDYEKDYISLDLYEVSKKCKDMCIYYSEGCYNNSNNPCIIRLLQTLSINP